MRNKYTKAVGAMLLLAGAFAASGAIVIQDLGTVAPPATLGSFTMTAFADDARAELDEVTSVASPLGGSLDFSFALSLRTVGSEWSTWSHGYGGDVYVNSSSSALTLTLPSGTGAFYVYAEPNSFGDYNITATSGGTPLTLSVNGSGGANGFGFYGSAGESISTIMFSSADTSGFAIGEFGIAAVPEPSTWLAGGFVGLLVLGRYGRGLFARLTNRN